MTATAPAETAGPHAPRSTLQPELRGRLVIADRVVARIASAVAAEIDGVAAPRPARRGRGRRGRPVPRRPTAVARIHGPDVHVSLSVSLKYPLAVAAACDEVRERVASRVLALTGLRASAVDIRVPVLRRGGLHDRRTFA
jgi:uncharacterized alkaline shock family protein YloU